MLELVRKADVVSENFRPGTLERWDLGYDRLAEANPGVVLARISGYGQTGPTPSAQGSLPSPRRWAACATSMASLGRHRRVPASRSATRWRRCSRSRASSRRSTTATFSATAADQVIDAVSLMEASFALLEHRPGLRPAPGSSASRPGRASRELRRRTSSNRATACWVVIAANAGDNVFRRLCSAMGKAPSSRTIRASPRTSLARRERRAGIDGIVAEWTVQHDAAEIDPAPQRGRGVVCGPILHDRRDLRGPPVPGAQHAGRAHRSRVRCVHRAGDRPEVLRDPGRSAVVRHVARGEATTKRSIAVCSGSPPTPSSRSCARRGVV